MGVDRVGKIEAISGEIEARDIAEKLKEAGAGLRSLAEPWADTTSPAVRMVLTVFAGIAGFARELIHQRTSSGQVVVKARGPGRASAQAHPQPDRAGRAVATSPAWAWASSST